MIIVNITKQTRKTNFSFHRQGTLILLEMFFISLTMHLIYLETTLLSVLTLIPISKASKAVDTFLWVS